MGIKNKQDMKFWIFVIFNETFLEQSIWYANEWDDDVIATQFSMYVIYKKFQIVIFLPRHIEAYPHIKIYHNKHYSAFI